MTSLPHLPSHGSLAAYLAAVGLIREFIATIWDQKKGRPHKCLERPAYLQIVPSLPWLRRIDT